MLYRVGERDATTVMRRALNRGGKTGFTAFRRALRSQTSIKRGTIVAATSFRRASGRNLRIMWSGWGSELPLKEFGAKQFSYGVRATVWGKRQQFRSAFIYAGTPKSGQEIADGHVFKRVSSRSLPIEKLYGPSIPKEMLKDETYQTFEDVQPKIMDRALHELNFLLNKV